MIGFGPSEHRSNTHPPTIVDIEKSEDRIESKSFSVCIGENGGRLSFGGMNEKLHLNGEFINKIDCSDCDWTSQYKVIITGIEVG